MAKLEKPSSFGRYELLRRIGAGGMGEVYLARLREGKAGAEDLCVVKKILPHLLDDRGFVARFVDEGKVVIHLSHGNIAQVFEVGDVDGEYFMAMEYVEGKTLAKVESRLHERGETLPIELALWIAKGICDGLAYAHRQADAEGQPLQVVHRDISPSNAMVTYDGDLKIIDFGAALSTLKEEMTAPRVVIGNLSYMAPEHARKQHVDRRADLFSVGVVLWEMTSWEVISAEGDHVERWRRAARPSFQKPSSFRKDLPREVDLIVMKALQVDVRERYQDAEMMSADLATALARIAPGTRQQTLGAFMQRLFDGERRAERRIITEALEESTGAGKVSRASSSGLTEIAHPFSGLNEAGALRSDPLPPLAGVSEATVPGELAAPREGSLRASMQATMPGRPALFAEDDLRATDRGMPTRTAPRLPAPLPEGKRTPRTAATPLPTWVQPLLFVGLGGLIGFAVVIALIELFGKP